MPSLKTLLGSIVPVMVFALLAACSSSSESIHCSDLVGKKIRAQEISLPTTGAEILSAAKAGGEMGGPQYCRVAGVIHPVDSDAPAFQFSIGLPDDWNQKAVQQGGGGYDGNLVDAENLPTVTDPVAGSPLMRGYVSFGSDGGHQQPDGEFALNQEAFANYAGDELKKTHDVAMSVIKTYYERAPDRTYFIGFSEGGREALYVTQRYPTVYDGVISGAPVYSLVLEEMGNIMMLQPHYTVENGFITPVASALVYSYVLEQCDGLDGLEDGIVANVNACNPGPAALLCPGAPSDDCLTAEQVASVNAIAQGYDADFKVANSESRYGGYPILKGGILGLGEREVPANPPVFGPDAGLWKFGYVAVRWFIVQEPVDLRGWSPSIYFDRIQIVSQLTDATSTNLDAFKDAGGKLILTHGTVDQYVSPENTRHYYERLLEVYGEDELSSFMKYYEIPGFDHGFSAAFDAVWDDLAALDAWVENGTVPQNQVVYDIERDGMISRSMPLCDYPSYPHFVSGDETDANSFKCMVP